MTGLLRGMKPYRRHAVPVRFGDILIKPELPIVPTHFGYVHRNDVPWGMCGNATAGNCVVAGGEHEHIVWALATGRPLPKFDDSTGLSDYSLALVAQGEAPYSPNDPSTDTGLDPVEAAQWRKSVGLTDANGNVHKIDAFVAIDNAAELDLAAYMFGVAGCCWDLPDSAEDQFSEHHVWDDTSGAGNGGHYTPYVGRNSKGQRMFVTWSLLQGATEAYRAKYMTGAVAYISREYLLATGKSPDGIDWDQLAARLNVLPGAA